MATIATCYSFAQFWYSRILFWLHGSWVSEYMGHTAMMARRRTNLEQPDVREMAKESRCFVYRSNFSKSKYQPRFITHFQLLSLVASLVEK